MEYKQNCGSNKQSQTVMKILCCMYNVTFSRDSRSVPIAVSRSADSVSRRFFFNITVTGKEKKMRRNEEKRGYSGGNDEVFSYHLMRLLARQNEETGIIRFNSDSYQKWFWLGISPGLYGLE